MYKYVGDFNYLKQLGFVKDRFETYWYLPTKSCDKYYNPLSVNIADRIVEYTTTEQLNILKGRVKLI